MRLNVGQRLRCAGSAAEVIIIRSTSEDVDLICAGAAMVPSGIDAGASGVATAGPHIEVGKRYVSAHGDLEVLCVKGGTGELAADGVPLSLKDSKPLPSSD